MFPRLQVGPLSLYTFGLLVMLGFVGGIFLARRLARERGLPGEAFPDAAAVILFASLAGARLLFVALNWGDYSARLADIIAIWQGGMSFHGGVIAGVVTGIVFMRRRRLPVLAMADAAAPALALGYAVGRLGCFLNGCCYGGPTGLPWAVPGAYCQGGDPALHYHPAQVYAAVTNLALTALLVAAYRRPHRAGQVLALYVVGYSVYRFAIEALRAGVTATVLPIGLTEAQLFSLVCVVLAAGWWLWLQRRGAPAPEPVPGEAAPAAAVTGA